MQTLKKVFGHIDCPTCATVKGMRITHDKNGDPFGYCEATCKQQLRIGGDKDRVKNFLKRFPWASEQVPAMPEPEPVKKAEITKPDRVPDKAPEPEKKKTRSAFEDALSALGVN